MEEKTYSEAQSQVMEMLAKMKAQNELRKKEEDEAEKNMAEGSYKPAPVVEQVMPKRKPKLIPKDNKEQEEAPKPPESPVAQHANPAPENSLPEEKASSSVEEIKADIRKAAPAPEPAPASADRYARPEPAQSEPRTVSVKNNYEPEPEPEPAPAAERNTVSVPPVSEAQSGQKKAKFKGPHRAKQRKVRYVDLEGNPIENFCIIEESTGEVHNLGSGAVIGSKYGACDIVLDNRYISRRHARIDNKSGVFYIEDLGSSNGTFINGNKLIPGVSIEIEVGTRIVFADTPVVFDATR